MALTGASLKDFIEENHLEGIPFNGIIHIGNEQYITDGIFTSPKEFQFTTTSTSAVSRAEQFGNGYLVTSNCRAVNFSVEEVQKAILEGHWHIVLAF